VVATIEIIVPTSNYSTYNMVMTMARPEKCKRICHIPVKNKFYCQGNDTETSVENQTLSIEEYETIRLIDHIGLTQEQCAAQMHVARTTVQRMYTDARRKIAAFLVTGSSLEIIGGNYTLCENNERCCQQFTCENRQCGCSCEFRNDDCIFSSL
jgi:predicted DNA-binding protein (UPF0251 family)